MGQNKEKDWVELWSGRIGKNLQQLRKAKGFKSAEDLAQRCQELNFDVKRSTIANIEAGRKREIPIHEILIYAQALNVAPEALIFPAANDLEVLPSVHAKPGFEWALWFSGSNPLSTPSIYGEHQTYWHWLRADPDATDNFRRFTNPLRVFKDYAKALEDAAFSLNMYYRELENLNRVKVGLEPSSYYEHVAPAANREEFLEARVEQLKQIAVQQVDSALIIHSSIIEHGGEVPQFPKELRDFMDSHAS